jgi:hypothetical protein
MELNMTHPFSSLLRKRSDPNELVPDTTEDGSMTKIEKVKSKSKYDKYLN